MPVGFELRRVELGNAVAKKAETDEREARDPEVLEKATRRRFTAPYKLDILERADECVPGSGDLGKLLRKEGLYTSHLTVWRAQRDRGALEGLEPKKRGRKPKERDDLRAEMERLRRENARLELRLKQAETIIEVQKKVSALLTMPATEENDSGRSA
jgi:transposase-like protein